MGTRPGTQYVLRKITCRTDEHTNERTGVPRVRSFSCSEPRSTVQFVSWGLIQSQGPRLALPCPELRRPHLLGRRMGRHFSRRTAALSRGPGHGRTGAERPWAYSRGAGVREPDSYSSSHPHWPRHLKKSCHLSLDLRRRPRDIYSWDLIRDNKRGMAEH